MKGSLLPGSEESSHHLDLSPHGSERNYPLVWTCSGLDLDRNEPVSEGSFPSHNWICRGLDLDLKESRHLWI